MMLRYLRHGRGAEMVECVVVAMLAVVVFIVVGPNSVLHDALNGVL